MNKSDLKPLLVIGGGGHASVLVDMLRSQNRDVLGVISPNKLDKRIAFQGLTNLHNDRDVFKYPADEVLLVNGIGVLPGSGLKRKLNDFYLSKGYCFETLISQNAQVSTFSKIEAGVQILAGAIIQAGVKIGEHTIVNTGAIVEHDSIIGEYNHIAPAATLCGQVNTSEGVYIGAGSTVIQNIKLGANATVGAGAVVARDLQSNEICYPSRSSYKSKL